MRWVIGPGGAEEPVIWLITHPLETAGQVNFSYAGIGDGILGASNKPAQIFNNMGSQVVTITVTGSAVPGDVVGLNYAGVNLNYHVLTGDTLNSIAASLANIININSSLQLVNCTAFVNGSVVTISSIANNPTVGIVSGTNAILTLASATRQTFDFTLTGTVVPGDNANFEINATPVFYTTVSGDTLSSVAANLAAVINANSTIQALQVTATSSGNTVHITSYDPNNAVYAVNVSGSGMMIATAGLIRGNQSKTTNFTYNTLGLVTQSVDPMNRTFSYVYDTNNIDLLQITETQRGDNFQIGAWTYNSQHRPLTYIDGSGQETQYGYNSSGQLTSITDANSNVTSLSYSGGSEATIGGTKTTGNVLTVSVHNSALTGGVEAVNYTVLAGDNLSSIAAGMAAAISADTSLHAIGVSASASGTDVKIFSTSVNATTYTSSVSGGATETISLSANTFGYLTKIDGPLSGSNDVTTFTFDTVGRLASRTDSEGYAVNYIYDNADRLTQTSYPDSTTEQIIYDRLEAAFTKDRIGRWSQSAFDSIRQLSFEIDPLGRKTQYTWCVCGSLAALTDPAGHITAWQHDLEGRPD